jgi:hypothetical protein
MASQPGTVVIKRLKPNKRKEAAFSQHGIERCTTMPFTQNKTVAVGPGRA